MSAGGTGLGLVVTKLVVERLGGTVSINSIKGARDDPTFAQHFLSFLLSCI